MIIASQIRDYVNHIWPERLSFDGDNVGLLVGRADKEVKKILITLDVDEWVVEEAIKESADVILSHHPLMFRPIKRLTSADPMQKTLMLLAAHDITLISAHTNLDCVRGGLNDLLAKKLGIFSLEVIEPVGEHDGKVCGFGRVGEVEEGTTVGSMLQRCVEALGIKGARYVGDVDRQVRKVAVNCGGGADEINHCIAMEVDLFITGDVKYNPFRDAYESGMAVIDAGHYETEHIVTELFSAMITENFSEIEIVESKANVPVVNYYIKK